MAKLVVEKDPVDGTDTHSVSGTLPNSAPYSGTGDYDYQGEVVSGLSTLVTVDGVALAVVKSASKLRSDGLTAHTAPLGKNFAPAGPNAVTLVFVPPTGVGDGVPSATAGSTLLKVDGVKALLDGDTFDTCAITGGKAAASVAAQGQSWVTSA